jgi:hypothetical protein
LDRSSALLLIIIVVGIVMAMTIMFTSIFEEVGSQADARKVADAYERSAGIQAQYNCHYLRGAEKANCVDRIFDRARDKQREEYQLAANRKAASWDAAAGKAASLGLLFSAVTILAVFLTFREQQRTTSRARAQFLVSRKHDRKSLAHTQRVTQAELRPYLFVEKIEVWERGGRGMFQLAIWLKNFGRTPARNIRAQIKAYASESVNDLRDFDSDDGIELGAAAPDHQRRAYWPLNFTEEEWANPSWACYGILRLAYTYTDDEGNCFPEYFDYYAEQSDLTRLGDPVFFLLTDWTRQRHLQRQEEEPELFSAETIERIRDRNLTAQLEEQERMEAEEAAEFEQAAKKRTRPATAKPKAAPKVRGKYG